MLQNFIELLSIPFGAGESRLLHLSGQYFEIVDATNPVDVLLIDKTGAQRGIMRGAEASFHLKNTDFSTIQITSATAQTIRIGYGSGEAGTRRAAGAVSIVGTVPVTGPLTDTQLRASAVPIFALQPGHTQAYHASNAIAANTPQTIVAPASNLNGIDLLAGALYDIQANNADAVVIAKASAPASITDGAVYMRTIGSFRDTTLLIQSDRLESAQFVPAGLGLYLISGGGTSSSFWAWLRLRVRP